MSKAEGTALLKIRQYLLIIDEQMSAKIFTGGVGVWSQIGFVSGPRGEAPPPPREQTRVKTLPPRNFVCGR